MDSGAVEAVDLVEWWPAIRRLAARRARAWDVEVDDLAQATAMLVLQRLRRGQEFHGWRTLGFCSLEAIRRIESPESRADRFERHGLQGIPGRRAGSLFELCSIPDCPDEPDHDSETSAQIAEWAGLSVRERGERILESRRALLCSV